MRLPVSSPPESAPVRLLHEEPGLEAAAPAQDPVPAAPAQDPVPAGGRSRGGDGARGKFQSPVDLEAAAAAFSPRRGIRCTGGAPSSSFLPLRGPASSSLVQVLLQASFVKSSLPVTNDGLVACGCVRS